MPRSFRHENFALALAHTLIPILYILAFVGGCFFPSNVLIAITLLTVGAYIYMQFVLKELAILLKWLFGINAMISLTIMWSIHHGVGIIIPWIEKHFGH